MNKHLIKDTLALFVITAVAALLLSLVYEITKDPISAQKQKQKNEAYNEVLTTADSFEDMKLNNAEGILSEAGIDNKMAEINEVAKGTKGGETVGYCIKVTDHEGYGGDIEVVVGIKADGTVSGISFLSIGETAGLGMKAKEPEFKAQFAEKKVDSFKYTKSGKTADNEIDALTGATVTTNAVTNAVNSALAYFKSLGGGANE